MKQLMKVFWWGALISFLGSLPLGVLNVTATQLAINSMIAAVNMQKISSIVPAESAHAFFSGMLLSALNPLHIIFWFGWSTILIEKNILHTKKSNYNFYTTGIGLGTLAGFAVFIYGGKYIIHQLLFNQALINWIISIVLLITVAVQVYKIRQKPLMKLAGE